MEKIKTVVVIPCYNVARFCEAVIFKTIEHADRLLLIDGASTDNTLSILKRIADKEDCAKVISFSRNYGKGTSLNHAFQYALDYFDFDVLVTIDSDGQHEPKEIPYLVQAIDEGADMAIGTRQFNKMPFRSRLGNFTIMRGVKFFYSNPPPDSQSGFRAFSKQSVQELVTVLQDGRYETEFDAFLHMLRWKKTIAVHPVKTIYIENNRFSSFSAVKDSLKVIKILMKHWLVK